MLTVKGLLSVVVVGVLYMGLGGTGAWAQMMTPSGPQWWPSRWGPTDEAGASNLMTPEKVVEAVKLIQAGKVYRLGRVYEHGMPMRGQRSYKLTLPTVPTGGPFGQTSCSTTTRWSAGNWARSARNSMVWDILACWQGTKGT